MPYDNFKREIGSWAWDSEKFTPIHGKNYFLKVEEHYRADDLERRIVIYSDPNCECKLASLVQWDTPYAELGEWLSES